MTEQTATPPAEPRVRRTLGLPVVGAIATATLIIGGLLGGIIGYAIHSDGSHSDGPDFGHQGGPGRTFQQGGPGDGQLPQPPSNG